MLRKSSFWFHENNNNNNKFLVSSLRVLGSGSSSSTPTIRCLKNPAGPCPQCTDAMTNPMTSKNKRGNPSLLLTATTSSSSTSSSFSILIDMGKTFRESLFRVGPEILSSIPPVKTIMLSHFHADAMNSLDDVREFSVDPIPCFCDHVTAAHVKRREPHLIREVPKIGADDQNQQNPEGKQKQKRYVGALEVNSVTLNARPPPGTIVDNNGSNDFGQVIKNVDVLGLNVDFCPLFHGRDCTSVGFIFTTTNQKRIAYFSDIGRLCADLDREVIESSKGCDLLFLDCIGSDNKFVSGAHFVLNETVAAAKLIQPKALRLVGMGHMDDHDALNEKLKVQLAGESFVENAECAHDGLTFQFST